MTVKWNPYWYALDQTIIQGDEDYFYLNHNNKSFIRGPGGNDSEESEVILKILKIKHKELGELKGVFTYGLDYRFFLKSGETLVVNAEEYPGVCNDDKCKITSWDLDVDVKIIERCDFPCDESFKKLSTIEKRAIRNKRMDKYKQLLGIDDID